VKGGRVFVDPCKNVPVNKSYPDKGGDLRQLLEGVFPEKSYVPIASANILLIYKGATKISMVFCLPT
jgi:hypothetical protein